MTLSSPPSPLAPRLPCSVWPTGLISLHLLQKADPGSSNVEWGMSSFSSSVFVVVVVVLLLCS